MSIENTMNQNAVTPHRVPKKKKNKYARQDNFWGYVLISPQVLGLLCFTIFPIFMSFYLCFTNWDFINKPELVGLQNFKYVLKDEVFVKTIWNTLIFVVGIVPLTMAISLGLAMLTNKKIKGLNFYKGAFFLPNITTTVAIALTWYWLFASDFGIINQVLEMAGIKGPGWMSDPSWSKVAIIIMNSWRMMGYYYLIFLAGLKGIPDIYYEAASIDGAGRFRAFRHITLPLLSSTTFFVFITMLIGVFNIFEEPFVLTRGGPAYSTYTLSMYIYFKAFKEFNMGEAAVASIVLFFLLGSVTALNFKLSKKWVNYIE
ncbi:multiple sugar transport system permease protein [Anaerotaenia torta]|uniref:carbohydrate ABC transporter permease n=1 Tax=Anaerotaenia torta TaxID=433293 RepID=UPI003D1F6861